MPTQKYLPLVLAALILAPLAACDTSSVDTAVDEPDPELRFLGGYRSDDDSCEKVGESSFTVDFLDDAADLVACPTGSADDTSMRSSGATVATQTTSYTLYSVARR